MKNEIIRIFKNHGHQLKFHFRNNSKLFISEEESNIVYETYVFDIIIKARLNDDDYGYAYSLTFGNNKALSVTIDVVKSFGEFLREPLKIDLPQNDAIDRNVLSEIEIECDNIKKLLIELIEGEVGIAD